MFRAIHRLRFDKKKGRMYVQCPNPEMHMNRKLHLVNPLEKCDRCEHNANRGRMHEKEFQGQVECLYSKNQPKQDW